MVKTLLVQYLPRKEQSNTKKLVDTFKKHAKGSVQELDIVQSPPDFFTPQILSAYIHRNYEGKVLTAHEKKAIKKIDAMTKQFREADIIVIAYPMFNFSLPGIMKTYFDAVMQKGETWDINENGFYGLMQDKKALVLTTSGGVYTGETEVHDFSSKLMITLFGFMEFDEVEIVQAQGLNQFSEKQDEIIAQANEKIKEVTRRWY